MESVVARFIGLNVGLINQATTIPIKEANMGGTMDSFLGIGSLRPYVGWTFDTDRLGGPRVGAEGGYFLKLLEDKELEKSISFGGLDILAFGETDPTNAALWATGGRVRWKHNWGIASLAAGTGVSVRNYSTDGTKAQAGVPFDVQAGLLFDTMFAGGGIVYYPNADPQPAVGEFKVGTDLFKLYAVLDALGWL